MVEVNNVTRVAKAGNKAILTNLCDMIDIEKTKQNLTITDRIPNKVVSRLVAGIKNVCPNITRHTVTNEYRRRKQQGIFYQPTTNTDVRTDTAGTDVNSIHVITPPRTKGGRPEGSTSKRRKHNELSEIAAKNEIATIFEMKRKEAGKKRIKKGWLDEEHAELARQRLTLSRIM